MLTLFQREGCSYSARIRRTLTNLGLEYRVVNSAKLATERTELIALTGNARPEVPALVDGDTVIQGTDAIIAHIKSLPGLSWFGDPSYGLTRTLSGLSYAEAVPAVKAALATQGFGVLTEIDVKATLKKKIDVDMRNYVILGACNPPLAHKSITAEPAIGLLLPCNVVVTEEADGSAVVSAIDPMKMSDLIDEPDIVPIAREVRTKLIAALAAIEPG